MKLFIIVCLKKIRELMMNKIFLIILTLISIFGTMTAYAAYSNHEDHPISLQCPAPDKIRITRNADNTYEWSVHYGKPLNSHTYHRNNGSKVLGPATSGYIQTNGMNTQIICRYPTDISSPGLPLLTGIAGIYLWGKCQQKDATNFNCVAHDYP